MQNATQPLDRDPIESPIGIQYRRPMARILLADDHAILRKGLKQLLTEDRATYDVGEASTGRETLDLLRQSKWNLLILDINMPDRSGVDILRQIQASHPDLKVLVLSGFPERQYAVNMIRAGACGYLNKEMAPEELLVAVKTVLSGKRYVSAALAELLVTELDSDSQKPAHTMLSEREFQIFCKLAAGYSVSAIGAELCLSVKTISTYRSRLMEKMGFKSNADITTYALRNQLIN
jgi:two-component system, NarL family, invasion response regulator UvrY